jgi:hypothetical protein
MELVSILPGVGAETEGSVEEHGHGDLATMLCDQFVALGHRRPAVARVIVEGDVVLVVLAWWEEAGKELLDGVAPTLAELVRIDARREIADLRTAVTPDGRRAMVSFVLGATTEDGNERRAALQGWAEQVRRNAIRQQGVLRERRAELRRFRTELARNRGRLRARF